MTVRYRIGVDIGGTFTDIVFSGDDGSLYAHKLLTTPDDFGKGIVDGIAAGFRDLGITPDAVHRVVHATTVATNAILENKGARTALITTAGFRDVLEMRRLRIPEMYTLNYRKPDPLVPRRLRLEVDERIGPDGSVWRPLAPESMDRALDRIAHEDVEAIAVCLLHSYAMPDHEKLIAERIRKRFGEEIYVTCSSDILPEMREYERTSTTVINAYLGPILRRYFQSLRRHLDTIGIAAPLLVMRSDGGIMSMTSAIDMPAQIVESGPAAGVIGAAYLSAKQLSRGGITLDMGGTTAKASIVEQGQVARTGDYEVGAGINLSSKLVIGGGHALKLPVIDISEIGAGGGSQVTIDAGGLLRVGPESAGSKPGPVAYDIGGEIPTFTDACICLGYVNGEYLVGGDLQVNATKARDALQTQLADRLDRSLLETAHGIFQVACGTMVRAVKAVSTYRGRDPRAFDLYAFGGNGPVVAAAIAGMIGMERVIIPMRSGVFSSFGLLLSDVEQEISIGFLRPLSTLTAESLDAAFVSLETQLAERMKTEGYNAGDYQVGRACDLRYIGQAHELTVGMPAGRDTATMLTDLTAAFGKEHERTYGHYAASEPIEAVALRVSARATVEKPERGAGWSQIKDRAPQATMRPAYFGADHGLLDTAVIARPDLVNGPRTGPLIVEEYDATCVVPPGWAAGLDTDGNIVLTKEG